MSPRITGTKKSRFTFWLPDATQKHLKRLQLATGKESVADVIRDAISVYKELLNMAALLSLCAFSSPASASV